jgi:hypothetical protein
MNTDVGHGRTSSEILGNNICRNTYPTTPPIISELA